MKVAVSGLLGLFGLVAVAVAALAIAGAATQSVSVQDNQYVDGTSGNSTTTITAGDTVLWTWSGANEHTVDNNGGTETFSSGVPMTSGTFTHTFNTPGTYSYLCGIHGTDMQGTIVVNAAAAPTNTPAPQATSTPEPSPTDTPQPGATSTATAAASTGTPASASPASPTFAPAPATTTNTGVPASNATLPAAGAGPADDAGAAGTLAIALAASGALIATAVVAMRLFKGPE